MVEIMKTAQVHATDRHFYWETVSFAFNTIESAAYSTYAAHKDKVIKTVLLTIASSTRQ